MAYAPGFNRPLKGNFDPAKGFTAIRVGSNAYLLEDELNEMQAILANSDQEALRTFLTTGVVGPMGGVTTTAPNKIAFDGFRAILDGLMVVVSGKGGADGRNAVELPAGVSGRTDLVFLEVFEGEAKASDPLMKHGTVGGVRLLNDLVDNRVNAETSRRLQLMNDLRVVAGATTPTTDGLGGPYSDMGGGLYRSVHGRLAMKLFTVNRTTGGVGGVTHAYPWVRVRDELVPQVDAVLANLQAALEVVSTRRHDDNLLFWMSI